MTRIEFAKGTRIDIARVKFEEAVVDSVLPPADDTGTIGTDLRRWSYIRGVVLASGHLLFANNFMIAENPPELGGGILFINEKGNSVAVLTSKGDLRIEGVFAHGVPVEEVGWRRRLRREVEEWRSWLRRRLRRRL